MEKVAIEIKRKQSLLALLTAVTVCSESITQISCSFIAPLLKISGNSITDS